MNKKTYSNITKFLSKYRYDMLRVIGDILYRLEDIEDCFQDVCLSLLTDGHIVYSNRGIKSYILRRCRNKAIDRARRRIKENRMFEQYQDMKYYG